MKFISKAPIVIPNIRFPLKIEYNNIHVLKSDHVHRLYFLLIFRIRNTEYLHYIHFNFNIVLKLETFALIS
jgi:hypothetical protein